MKHCKDCPVEQETLISEQATSGGCLPDYWDMKKWFNDTGKVWSCHCNTKRPCNGFINRLRDWEGREVPNNPILITEETTLEEIYSK